MCLQKSERVTTDRCGNFETWPRSQHCSLLPDGGEKANNGNGKKTGACNGGRGGCHMKLNRTERVAREHGRYAGPFAPAYTDTSTPSAKAPARSRSVYSSRAVRVRLERYSPELRTWSMYSWSLKKTTLSAPGWSKAVESAALEAAGSST